MKSVLMEERTAQAYPCLMYSTREAGLLVLFSEPGMGTVVKPDDNDHRALGEHMTGWAMVEFMPLRASVVLSNS